MRQEYPQNPHVLAYPFSEQVNNVEFRATLQVLSQDLMTQANRMIVVPMKLNVGTVETRVRDFNRMDPLDFHGFKVEE